MYITLIFKKATWQSCSISDFMTFSDWKRGGGGKSYNGTYFYVKHQNTIEKSVMRKKVKMAKKRGEIVAKTDTAKDFLRFAIVRV
jgi:hypothetical protein